MELRQSHYVDGSPPVTSFPKFDFEISPCPWNETPPFFALTFFAFCGKNNRGIIENDKIYGTRVILVYYVLRLILNPICYYLKIGNKCLNKNLKWARENGEKIGDYYA